MAVNRLYGQTDVIMPPMDVVPGAGAAGGTALAGAPVVRGQIPGVLVNNASSAGVGVMARDGIWTISVKGIDQSGNSAVVPGDILYFTAADTPPVSKKNTGVRFGYALGAVASAGTASIPVQLGY